MMFLEDVGRHTVLYTSKQRANENQFSHVQHLVSEVSGVLRPGKTRFDAFRSIFPAGTCASRYLPFFTDIQIGTVSGAPKVRAMELIAELEREKRGVYAGAVGYFGYGSVEGDKETEGAMDVSGLYPLNIHKWLMQADVHRATDHACQRRHRLSPSRGKCEV